MTQVPCQIQGIVMQGEMVTSVRQGEVPVLPFDSNTMTLVHAVNFLRSGAPQVQIVVDSITDHARQTEHEKARNLLDHLRLPGERFILSKRRKQCLEGGENYALTGEEVWTIKREKL